VASFFFAAYERHGLLGNDLALTGTFHRNGGDQIADGSESSPVAVSHRARFAAALHRMKRRKGKAFRILTEILWNPGDARLRKHEQLANIVLAGLVGG